jgi:hypothetical protein
MTIDELTEEELEDIEYRDEHTEQMVKGKRINPIRGKTYFLGMIDSQPRKMKNGERVKEEVFARYSGDRDNSHLFFRMVTTRTGREHVYLYSSWKGAEAGVIEHEGKKRYYFKTWTGKEVQGREAEHLRNVLRKK